MAHLAPKVDYSTQYDLRLGVRALALKLSEGPGIGSNSKLDPTVRVLARRLNMSRVVAMDVTERISLV